MRVHRLRGVIAVGTVTIALAGCGGASYTVGDAASAIMASEPGLAPFTSNAYDTCVATFLFNHMTANQVQTLVTSAGLQIEAHPVFKAAESNCVFAGT